MLVRTISAIVFLILFIPIVIYGELPVLILVGFLAAVCLYEILKMNRIHIFSIPGIISLIALAIIVLPNKYLFVVKDFQFEAIVVLAILALSFTVLSKNRFTFVDMGFCVISVLYIGFGFMNFYEIRETGLEYIAFALLIVWGTDTGAYLFGRLLGRHKLWPQISPNKTIEGALGGIITAVAVGIIFFGAGWIVHLELWLLLLYAIILSIFGQLGDLVESALKRHFDVKDSGSLMPGHGGVLDCFDSLIFVLPIMSILPFLL